MANWAFRPPPSLIIKPPHIASLVANEVTFGIGLSKITVFAPQISFGGLNPGASTITVSAPTADMGIQIALHAGLSTITVTAEESFFTNSIMVINNPAQITITSLSPTLSPIAYGDPSTQRIIGLTLDGIIYDFSYQAYNFSFTTQNPGGDSEATWQIEKLDDDPSITPPLGTKIILLDDAGFYWVGRLEEPQIDQRLGGRTISYIARGYGSSTTDQVYETSQPYFPELIANTPDQYIPPNATVFPAGTSLVTVFQYVRNFLCPKLDQSNIYINASGEVPLDTQDFVGQTATQVFSSMASVGSGGIPLVWGVRGYQPDPLNPLNIVPVLEVKNKPDDTESDYSINFLDCQASPISYPMQWIKNRVIVRWSGGVVSVQDDDTIAMIQDTIRDHYVNASNTLGNPAQALSAANIILNTFGKVKPYGRSITINYPANSLVDINGLITPPWRVRSGNTINVLGLTSENDNLPVGPMFIQSTSWDEEKRLLTIQTEQQISLAQIIGKVLPIIYTNPVGLTPDQQPPNSGLQQGPPSGEAPTPVQNLGPTIGTTGFGSPTTAITSDQLPSGFTVKSLNFVANGGGNPIQSGTLGWQGIDFPIGLTTARITCASDSTTLDPGTIHIIIWKQSGDGFPGSKTTLIESTLDNVNNTGILVLDGHTLNIGDIWGVDVSDDVTTTAVVLNVWLTGNQGTSPAPTSNPNPTAPVIANLQQTTGNQPGTFTVSWDTESATDPTKFIVCTDQVEFSTDPTFPANKSGFTPISYTLVNHHVVKQIGLTAGTWYIKAYCTDVNGNNVVSDPLTVTVT